MPGLARDDGDVGAVFAALADPTRREVVRSLAQRPGLTASHLAGELPMTRQAVAKHLSALSGAGLVQARREGRETRYTLTPAPLAGAIEWMTDVGAAVGRPARSPGRPALCVPSRRARARAPRHP